MKVYIIAGILVALLVVVLVFSGGSLGTVDVSQGNNVTNGSSTVGTAAVEVFSQNGALARFVAVNGPSDVFCSVSATSTGVIANEGMLLKASSTEWFATYEGNLHPEDWWCLTASGTSTLNTVEIY